MSSNLPSIHSSKRRQSRRGWSRPTPLPLRMERLEPRDVPSFSFPLFGGEWKEMGPRNIAAVLPGETTTSPGNLTSTGRITSVAIHPTDPDIFYVAAAGGGVAKTLNGGLTWRHLTDRLPDTTPGITPNHRTTSMGAIALSRIDPNIIFAGQGEPNNSGDSYPGYGVLRSKNAGATWELIRGPGDVFVGTTISRIITVKPRINPNDPNSPFETDPAKELVFMSIQSGTPASIGIWRSKDGGDTWLKISGRLNLPPNPPGSPDPGGNGVPATSPITDIAVDPTNPKVMYVAIGRLGGPPDPRLPNGVYRTENAMSDTPMFADPPQTPPDQQIGTPWTIVFGGNGGPQTPSGLLLGRMRLALAPSAPSTFYIAAGAEDGAGLRGVYRTNDRGTTWLKFGSTGEGGNLPVFVNNQSAYDLEIAVDPANPARLVLGGDTGNYVVYTEDATNVNPNAVTWSVITQDADGEGPHVDVHALQFAFPDDKGTPTDPTDDTPGQLLIGTDGGVFRTISIVPIGGGKHAVDWVSANGKPGPHALNTTQFVGMAIHPFTPDIYLGGLQDNGTLLFNDTGNKIAGVDIDGNPIKGGVPIAHRTPEVDGGDGGDVVYDFVDPNNVYRVSPVASFGAANFVRKSQDGGKTWVSAAAGITNPNASLFYMPIAIDPSQQNRLFVGTDVVNESIDKAASWRQLGNQGLPFVTGVTPVGGPKPVVTAIGIGRSDQTVVYAAVLNRGWDPGIGVILSWGPAIYRIDLDLGPQPPEPAWRDVSPFLLGADGTESVPRFNGAPGLIMPPYPGAPPGPAPNDFAFFTNITALTVDPFDANIVYAVNDNRDIIRTTNGGITWRRINDEGLPIAPPNTFVNNMFQDLVVDPNLLSVAGQVDDFIYIATHSGVYRLFNPTVDPDVPNPDQTAFNNQQWFRVGGETYQLSFTDPNFSDTTPYHPDVRVDDLELNTATGILSAATHGRGIWQFQIRPYVSGIAFEDINGNGIRDVDSVTGLFTDPAVENLRIIADRIEPLPPIQAGNTLTDSRGFYAFRALEDGRYIFSIANASQIPVDKSKFYYGTTTPVRDYVVDENTTRPFEDLGAFVRTSISGLKYEDVDGDGVRDTGEPVMAGVVIQLLNSDNDAVLATTTSAADGTYSFTNLGPLQDRSVFNPTTGYRVIPYRVREIPPAGWLQTSFNPNDIFLSSNTPVTGIDFGNFKLAKVGGTVFEDIDGDSTLDAGEPGLAGWTVQLWDNKTQLLVTSTVTPAGGGYQFTNIGPGEYFVRELPMPNWIQTTLNPAPFQAFSGTDLAGVDFGNFQSAGFSGVAWEDINGDGIRQATETTVVPGATVTLFDGQGNVLATDITDGVGFYSFAGLFPLDIPGNSVPHRASITAPAIFAQTSADRLVTLRSNTVTPNQDLGLFRRTSISGFAFEDINGNGVQEAGEPPLRGGSVALLNSKTGAVVGTTTTDSGGNFTFMNLGPLQDGGKGGTVIPYNVSANPAGFVQTTPDVGDIFLQSGVPFGGITIGLFKLANFSGRAFVDIDGDGKLDSGEVGFANQTIALVDANTKKTVTTTQTDSKGFYTLLAGPGTWTVREVVPAGWVLTTPNPGNTTVLSGQVVTTSLFGNFRLISVSGLVYHDINGNAIREGSEPGLSPWTVQLINFANGSIVASATTNSAGAFIFPNVGPGSYLVREIVQTGWRPTTTDTVGIDARSGQNATAAFGNFRPAAATGRVYEDLDRTNTINGSEVGVGGFTVQVRDLAGGVVASGLSDAAGNYAVTGLPPGTYRVNLVLPSGWVRTGPDPAPFTVTSGQSLAVGNLGVLRLASASGSVFRDTNRDGVRQSFEIGVPGTVIALFDENGTQVATNTANANGEYRFENLQAGTYTVRVGQLPSGFALSGPRATPEYLINVTTGSSNPGNTITNLDFGVTGRKRYALAADGGGGPRVQVYDAASGDILRDFFVYEVTFTGGVRVASADVTGDGTDDLIVVPGPGGGPRLRVLDGVDGREIYNFFTYEPTFIDGLYVAAGDVNGDGFADMITGTSPGGGPRVTVYSGKDGSQIADFFAYDSSFRGGVRVAAGDVNGDGISEVITGSGPGGSPTVNVFNGRSLALSSSFLAFDPGYLGGIFVGAGTAGLAGFSDIIVGSGQDFPGTPVARTFNAAGQFQIEVPAFGLNADGSEYDSEVRVTLFDRSGDNIPDYVMAAGPGEPPRLRILDGRNRRQIDERLVFEATFLGGVYIG